MRHLVYNVRCYAVPVNSSLSTITLYSSVKQHNISIPVHDVISEFDCTCIYIYIYIYIYMYIYTYTYIHARTHTHTHTRTHTYTHTHTHTYTHTHTHTHTVFEKGSELQNSDFYEKNVSVFLVLRHHHRNHPSRVGP